MTDLSTWQRASTDPGPFETLARKMIYGQAGPGQGPQAQALAQDASHPLGAHYHEVAQFQVITGGSGRIGPHMIADGQAHYVDRHTVYGPVKPALEGLRYVTLRASHDPGPSWMPDAAGRLASLKADEPTAPHRNVVLDLGYAVAPVWTDLVNEPDGLRVAVIVTAAHWTLEPFQMAGAGGYALLLFGRLTAPGMAWDLHGPGSLFFDPSIEDIRAPSVLWLPAGAVLEGRTERPTRLVALQFPSNIRSGTEA